MVFKKTGESNGFTILSDTDGNTALFDFIEMTAVGGCEYAAMCEADTGEPVILRMLEDGAAETYETVDDDDVFERVCRAFAEEFPDEFDF